MNKNIEEELRRRYNPEGSTLRKQQNKMFEILILIDKLCEKYKINYWLSDGTLLGAVRHGGFIPWDDDLDINMMKSDYLKFIEIAKVELPSNLKIQTHETDKGYYFTYGKIRDLDSILYEDGKSDRYFKYKGIYVDIFPMEYTSPPLSKFSAYWHWRTVLRLSFLKNDRLGIKEKLNHTLFILSNAIYSLFNYIDKIFKNNELSSAYGSQFLSRYPNDVIFPLSKIEFEGHTFNAPNNPDEYLRILFGNYLESPEESARMTHVLNIEFNTNN